jgi:hypothetical protein
MTTDPGGTLAGRFLDGLRGWCIRRVAAEWVGALLAKRAAAAGARHWEGGELGNWERTECRSAGNGIVVGHGLEPTESEPVHNEGRSTQTYAELKGAALQVMHPHPPLSLFPLAAPYHLNLL